MPQPEKIDFKQLYKELYTAKKTVQEVKAEKATFLAVDGVGAPGSSAYQEAIGQLYGLVHTTKFMLKNANLLDFGITNLECLWFDNPSVPMSDWRWRLLIRIPDEVSAQHLKDACTVLTQRKDIDTSTVKRITWTEGRAIQIMHIGPFDQVSIAYDALAAFAQAHNLVCGDTGHEIYLSDPHRVAAEKLKTIVRMTVKRK